MQTLTYGYKKPQDGDKGQVVFDAIEEDIQRANDHTHNGTDSAPLPAQSILGITQAIASADWVANGATGFYRQLVTVPAGFDFDKVHISVRTSGSSGEYVYPQIERVSTTQYYIYTIDNSQAFVACYGG